MRRFEEENIKKRLEEVKIHTKAFFSFPDIVGTSSSAATAVVARPSFSRKNFHENKAFFQEKAGRRRLLLLLLTVQWCCVSVAVLLLEVWKNDH